jgi:uroporphyrinogen decarboxylase
MRQAGRYHKHYQALRARHSFMELCKDPELAAEVAMGPIEDFDFDVAILFSDLLFPLEAMGMGLTYDPAPELGWRLDASTLPQLRAADEAWSELLFQKQAMRRTRERLPKDKSLIGFVGGPWTLFAYAVEGGHKGGLVESKKNLRLFAPFCERLLPLLKRNIELQLDGGAEVVMLFDTAAGELSPLAYLEAIPGQLERLACAFPGKLGYYAKGVGLAHLRHKLFDAGSPLAGLGLDHRWHLPDVLANKPFGFLQGNFDQAMLFMNEPDFIKQASPYFEAFQALPPEKRAGWVCGLGHGVLPSTPEANVRHFVRLAREVFSQ